MADEENSVGVKNIKIHIDNDQQSEEGELKDDSLDDLLGDDEEMEEGEASDEEFEVNVLLDSDTDSPEKIKVNVNYFS